MVGPLVLISVALFLNQEVQAQNDPPKITERPRNQAVKAGGIAAFYCEARGDPDPTIVWRKNGKKVSSTQSRYQVVAYPGGSMLRIEPVRAGRDEAVYECFAENGVGDAVSAEATLVVYEVGRLPPGFPQVNQPPSTKVVEIGHTAVLSCLATGNPPPTIRWVKDLRPVQIGKNARYTILDSSKPSTAGSVRKE